MASENNGLPVARWISVAAAADLIGKRFHSDWSETDPSMLEFDRDVALDREAWDRAKHVQDLLSGYVSGGRVTAYAPADDGGGVTDLPRHWVTDSVFTLCIRTGTYRLDFDIWEQCWIDERELREALPSNGQPRKKHKFEWDKVVHEAWMFTLQQDRLPTNAAIVRHLGEWSPANNQNVPDGSLLSKTAKTILDFLKENKTGWEHLKSGSFEAANETDE
jgi:hypothetical protein